MSQKKNIEEFDGLKHSQLGNNLFFCIYCKRHISYYQSICGHRVLDEHFKTAKHIKAKADFEGFFNRF
jgi:hypothetical protein